MNEAQKNRIRVTRWREKKKEEGLLPVQIMLKPGTVKVLRTIKKLDSSATYSSIIETAIDLMMNTRRVLTRKGKIDV